MLTNWSQVFDMREARNFEAFFLRNLVCLPHGPFENELYDLGATILEIDAAEHAVAHFLFLEAVSCKAHSNVLIFYSVVSIALQNCTI